MMNTVSLVKNQCDETIQQSLALVLNSQHKLFATDQRMIYKVVAIAIGVCIAQ